MPPSGYSGTPLAKKLGISEGSVVATAGAPKEYAALLEPLPTGVRITARVTAATDVVHVFTRDRATLARSIAALRTKIRPNAAVWVSWPKKASKVPTDITEDVIREVCLPLGFVDVKVCAVDETWSGLKLVIRKERRASLIVAAALLASTVCSCAGAPARTGSEPSPGPAIAGADDGLKLATWNIAWLTKRDPRIPRTPEDYAALRRHAEGLDADVIALQEVDGADAAGEVFDPAVYRFHFTGDSENVQRAGFAWKKGLDVVPGPDLDSLAREGPRRGAEVTIRWGGRQLRLLSVHLKSGCPDEPLSGADENCRILSAQLPDLEAWVDARAREGVPYAVLGDFNRAFHDDDPFWRELDDATPPGADLTDAGAGAKPACWNGRFDRYIDHIVLSPAASAWVARWSFHELVFDAGTEPSGGLSDHCPLAVVLEPPGGAVRARSARARISAKEAADRIGRLATVCGRVASARFLEDRSRMTFLNLEGPHPDQPFTIVIRGADRAGFGTPEKEWAGKRVCVTGMVERYRGKPQIVARTPDQIQPDSAR